ncbi:MAG: pyridoxamine 5'-phosphate oxidase, partial [Nostocales cyanobacterium]
PEAFTPPAPNPLEPLETFCLLLLEPTKVDHLQLRGEPQNRTIYQINEHQNWETQEINP